MKRPLLLFVLSMSLIPMVNSQTLEKIKGDRNVTVKQTYIDDFKRIVVTGDLSVEIVYNSKPSVEIEADDNLHEVIKFDVIDGVLKFEETMNITSKKKLQITVNYGDGLQDIEVHDAGEIRSLTSMELGPSTLITQDNARAYLNINASQFDYKSSGKSKTRLNLSADSVRIELNDYSKLDALINSKTANFDLYQRSDAVIEGNANTSVIRLDSSTSITGEKFDVKRVDAILEGNSDLTISAMETIKLAISGDSEVYLYGSPAITIETFEDSAKLQKKMR
jgi:hypothetical protein